MSPCRQHRLFLQGHSSVRGRRYGHHPVPVTEQGCHPIPCSLQVPGCHLIPIDVHRWHPFFMTAVERGVSPSPCSHCDVTLSLHMWMSPIPVRFLCVDISHPVVRPTCGCHRPCAQTPPRTRGHSTPRDITLSPWSLHARGCHCVPGSLQTHRAPTPVPLVGTVSGGTALPPAPCPSCRPPPPPGRLAALPSRSKSQLCVLQPGPRLAHDFN